MNVLRQKLELLLLQLIMRLMSGRSFPGERLVDVVIRHHKALLKLLCHDDQREIMLALINWMWPTKHIHENPQKRTRKEAEAKSPGGEFERRELWTGRNG
jgi:hypothetical protein